MTLRVTKRNGNLEPLDLSKFHKVVMWACENISNVSVSEIELRSQISFYDKIKTSDIQETLIKAAADLISENTPNYQYVASRLINYHLRKEVYNSHIPIDLYTHYINVMEKGFYTRDLFEKYSKEEFEYLNKCIDHNRDFDIAYAGMEQYRGKYLVRDRTTKKYYETPQMALMLISMCAFINYDKKVRLKYVEDFYNSVSKFEISLPTPIMAGLRTNQKQFSSCVLIDCDDSLDSINATASSIVKYVSQKAGIGVNIGRIRAVNSPIRNGEVLHTGLIPFIKYFQAAVKSCNQGGVRAGSATFYYPIIHLEVEDLLVLKNNKGIEENRARHVDYAVQFNRIIYERLLEGKNITLFSPSDVPDLFEAFYIDNEKFKNLYEKYENDKSIKRRKTISAINLFTSFMEERKDTGRIYLMNVDHCNDHGSYIKEKAPIYMSNLCLEITNHTKPLNDLHDSEGEIALCTLGAINWGKINKPKDFEKPCSLLVRALDEILTYQNYPIKAAYNSTIKRRHLGIGITNFAFWLVKNNLNYQNITREGLQKIHEYAEAWSYYIIKTSIELAKEKGPCLAYGETKYSLGIMPIDTYKKEVDELVDPIYNMDWNDLREKAKQYGIRNSTLMAVMPTESSSQVNNSTNGIEPPRALVSVKQSKDGVLKQVVPGCNTYKNKYDLLWNQKTPIGYLKICAVLQKFIDQAISVNTSYNPKYYENNEIPLSELLQHVLFHYKYGGKTLYYFNTYDMAGELPVSDINENETCQSCIL